MSVNGEKCDFIDPEERNKRETHQQGSSFTNLLPQEEMNSNNNFTAADGSAISSHYAIEINQLKLKNKQLKLDLQTEQDVVINLRKRLNNVEKQKLETATRTNEEIASLESQLAKVRLQIEKGEAARHNLEYELAKSQKEINQIRQASKNKENIFIEGTDDLNHKIENLSDEIKHLQKSLQTCKISSQEQENKMKENLDNTNQQFLKCRTELDSVCSERDKLNELCQQHTRVISDLNDKLDEFENEKENVLDSLRRATNELKYAKEREDMLSSELEAAQSRIKLLEENIESERASTIETKFNSEIVLLRIKDLEGAIDAEKSVNFDANKAIERLTQQNRELEQVYEEERRNRKEFNKKLDKMEKEHMIVRQQLTSEVENKKSVIDNLSKELEKHQKNFNALKSELSKAKKHQQYLEETYGGSFKELELFLQTFHFGDKKLRMSRKDEATDVNKGRKVTNPSILVDHFKLMFAQLKRKMDGQTEELLKAKKIAERLTKELESSKELVKAKDKTIEDTQKNYTKTAKDLNKARSNYAELESTMRKLKSNLQQNTNSQQKDRTCIQELTEEIMKLVKRHQAEEEEKTAFLYGLHQHLLSSHVIFPGKDRAVNQFDWAVLADIVSKQISLVVELLHTSQEKLKASNNTVREKHDTIVALKHEHTELLTRLTNTLREREATWQQQREDLENNYNKMLSDLKCHSKKTQVIADHAWEKVRATGSVQQGLESELVELRRSLAESQVHVSALLSACALLSGAFYPLYTRVILLASERHVLEDLYTTWENCRERALYLCNVLRSGKDSDQDKPERDRKFQRKMRPLLWFRIGVITVMAANRLLNLGHRSANYFVTYTAGVGDMGLIVSFGDVDSKQRRFTGAAGGVEIEDESFTLNPSGKPQNTLKSWLNSPALLEAVVASMTELQKFSHHGKEPFSPGEAQAVVSAARSSFGKFIDRLSQFFSSSALSEHTSRSSLLYKLEKRLSKTLSSTPFQLKGNLISSQDLMCSLQNHILDLTQRLHTAEKERRHFLTELNELKQKIIGDNNLAQKKNEKSSAKGTESKYVPMSKFEQVCMELSNALHREQRAQELMQEQSNQLSELTSRLDHCTSDAMEQQDKMVQLQESLTETQNELIHKEQTIRQGNKNIEQIQYERDSFQSNLKDAENAMRNAIRGKEILSQYIKNVETALEMAKRQLVSLREPWTMSRDLSLPRLLLDTDLIPQDIGHVGPELIAMQNLVGSFIELQQQTLNKIRSLQEEIISHRTHIDTLKQELNDAIHREFIEQHESLYFDVSTISHNHQTPTSGAELSKIEEATDGALIFHSDQSSSGREIFVPLKVDQEECSPDKLQAKTLITPTIYHGHKSAFQSFDSNSKQMSKKSIAPKQN